MKEAEKRRERLRAMREEAAGVSSDSEAIKQQTLIITPPLCNPLVAADDNHQSPPLRPRFDFYTDPLAAFSSHNHSTATATGSTNSASDNFYNSQHIRHPGVPFCSPNSTAGVSSPYHGHPVSAPIGFHQATPSFASGPYRAPHLHNSPNTPYPGHQGSPNFVPRAPGRGPWPNRCPSPTYGRGRGRWDSGRTSPDLRYSGAIGRGHAFDARGRAYYDKSMVEDPWHSLTPIIWQPGDEATFFNSWGSIKITSGAKNNRGSVRISSSSKKPRVSKALNNEPSLAEFLAAAADEGDGDDAGTM